MNPKVSVPKALRWRCSNPCHAVPWEDREEVAKALQLRSTW
jgi:hypothetical protein